MDQKTQEKLGSFYEYAILGVKLVFVIFLFNILRIMAVAKGNEWVFLDYANFVIHEGGHFLFSHFSDQLWTVLGGTLTQLLVPLLLSIYFLISRNKFASGFCFFWFGNNFVNISPYIGDARCQCMDIVGNLHDWNFILNNFGLLNQDSSLASLSLVVGLILCLISLLLMILNIYHDFRQKMAHS